MNATGYLEKQLANIHVLLHDIAGDLTEHEWLLRPAPGQNMIGFTVWHIPRTQDNLTQVWIRGVAEVFHRPNWSQWRHLQRLGIGVGITEQDAEEIARTVHLAETLEYAEAVHQEMLAWLRQLSDGDLDKVPAAVKHLGRYPEYQTEGYYQETKNLLDQPIWSLLMRPCIGHVHRHLGELQLAKEVIRSRQ